MFKWLCFGLAVVFVTAILVMVNDIRVQVHRSAQVVLAAERSITDNLPVIVEKTRTTADTISGSLPEVVERVQTATEVMAELAEDIRQLKELAGLSHNPRDKNLIAYADDVLKTIEATGGVIGVHNNIRAGLKNTKPVKDWVSGARKEALFLTLLVSTKKDMARRLAKTKLGFNWYIQPPGKSPKPLLDWLKANHPETKQLDW